jgi:prolyl oligopeptidase
VHTEIQQYLKKLLNQRSPSFYELAECHGLLFAMNSQPGQQQDALVTLRSPDDLASKHIVVDPNQIDPTHSTAIQFYVPSIDGGKVAVSLASGGTESGNLHIYDVATGVALPDVVPRVSVGGGSVAWNADGSGLYYTHYPREGERPPADLSFHEQVYYHKLVTPAIEDSYIIGKDFPSVAEISLTTNDDGRYLLAMVANGDGGTYEHILRDPTGKWTRLTQFSDQVTAGVFGADGVYMLSRDRAPRGKLVRVSLTNPDFAMAQTVIPETSAVLQDFRFSLSASNPSYAITRAHL